MDEGGGRVVERGMDVEEMGTWGTEMWGLLEVMEGVEGMD